MSKWSLLIKTLFILAMLLLGGVRVFAQIIVSGTVTDTNKDPLLGVTVKAKGLFNSTAVTDIDGKYSLEADENGSLEFSYIGMNAISVSINGKTDIDVQMNESSKNLEEVVVLGYGTQKRIHLTGSVASISKNDLMKATTSNLSQSLVGKLPGLITQQALGTPGADNVTMLIRGYSSYNGGASVLTLVDGVERNIAQVDPNDIENVTVLKDAAACAVYGMKAANGVILVTTKKGNDGKPTISYRGSMTFSKATTMPKMMNGTQYMEYYNLGLSLDALASGEAYTPFFSQEDIDATHNGDLSDGFENTDWTSPIFKTTFLHQHSMSVLGGTDKIKYYISGGFLNQNGIIKGNRNRQWNLRSNLSAELSNDLKAELNLSVRNKDYYQPGGYSYANQQAFNIFHLMLYSLPFVPKEYNGMATSAYRSDGNAANAVYGSENSGFSNNETMKLETSAKLEYAFPFLKGLSASLFLSYDWQDLSGKTFNHAYDLMQYHFATKNYTVVPSAGFLANGQLYESSQKDKQLIIRPALRYNASFGKNDVGALFLYEQNDYKSNVLSGSRSNFPLFDIPDLSFADVKTSSNSGSSGHSRRGGYVGMMNYAYDNKYLAEFSFRYDGSYLFAKGHRWGFFPSLSLGWVVSGENWFKDKLANVDLLKVRASAGMIGNDNVPAYLYRKAFGLSPNSVAFGLPAETQITLYNTTPYVMNELTWEKTRSFNVGVDLEMWRGLFGFELDVFYKYTYDILQNVSGSYPASLGGSVPSYANDGTFDNRGFELTLKHRNRISEFEYSVNGNLSWAHNKILSKREADGVLPWQSIIGASVGSIWGLKSAGLYQSQEEIDNGPKPIASTPRVGDVKYVDINGDGKISNEDRVKIGRSTIPEMMYSLTLNGSYKGFDMSVLVQGAALCDKMLAGSYNNGAVDATSLTVPFYGNYDNAPLFLMENSWTPDNTNAEFPRLTVNKAAHTNNYQLSDFWKRNGAYCRLKNVVIGYTLPRSVLGKSVGSCRLFLSGYNLFTVTGFKYLDPESTNVITGYYPQQRTFSIGVEINL